MEEPEYSPKIQDVDHTSEEVDEQEESILYTPEVSTNVQELLSPVSKKKPVGVDLDQLAIEHKDRLQYNKLSREIKKRKAREINFDHCAGWAGSILELQSKDLRVATWLAIAALWSESANETEKLEGFRDGIVLLQKLISTYGDELHPLIPQEKIAALSEFGNSNRLSRISRIETQQKKERYKVTDETIERLLEENAPVSLRNDLRELLHKEYQKESFLKFVKETAFERFEPSQDQMERLKKSKNITDPNKEAAIEYYLARICDLAAMPVEYPAIKFSISKYTIKHLAGFELPGFVMEDLVENKALSAVGEDKFEARLQQRVMGSWRAKMDKKELVNLSRLIVDYSNQNRWIWFEIESVVKSLDEQISTRFVNQEVSLTLLHDLIKVAADEMRTFVGARKAEEDEKQEGYRGQIKDLEEQIGLLKEKLLMLEGDNDVLRRENAILKTNNLDEESTVIQNAKDAQAPVNESEERGLDLAELEETALDDRTQDK